MGAIDGTVRQLAVAHRVVCRQSRSCGILLALMEGNGGEDDTADISILGEPGVVPHPTPRRSRLRSVSSPSSAEP